MRIVVSGGGTAGHVLPALATAGRLSERFGATVSFIGTGRGVEAELVPGSGYELAAIDALPFVRRFSTDSLRSAAAFARSIKSCRPLVREADAVLGMGGYASGPAAAAAIREHRPLVLHEQNAVPGLANKVFSRRAQVVALTFAEAGRRFPERVHTVVTGNPVRAEIASIRERREALRTGARRELGLEPDRATVVLFGGSQGALHINRAAVGAASLLAERDDLQMLLITGRAHYESLAGDAGRLRSSGKNRSLRLLAYVDRMEGAYAAADLIVCRAGATSIAEVTSAGLPSLLVPYPYATGGHQEANARALERAGAARVLLDDRLNASSLAGGIEELLHERSGLAAMARAAVSWGKPDAADVLADVVAATARSN